MPILSLCLLPSAFCLLPLLFLLEFLIDPSFSYILVANKKTKGMNGSSCRIICFTFQCDVQLYLWSLYYLSLLLLLVWYLIFLTVTPYPSWYASIPGWLSFSHLSSICSVLLVLIYRYLILTLHFRTCWLLCWSAASKLLDESCI